MADNNPGVLDSATAAAAAACSTAGCRVIFWFEAEPHGNVDECVRIPVPLRNLQRPRILETKLSAIDRNQPSCRGQEA
jgi:hypothetical protein